MQSEHIMIPLSQLVRSPFNVRKTQGAPVDKLAASIASKDLIHNLVVHPLGRGKKFGVADGGRRLEAMLLLVSQKKWKASREVSCRQISQDEAVEMSLSANVEREAMHPCDEFDAMQALVNQGKSVETIAASFGVTPIVVTRRLRLANVAPMFLTMFRAGDIDLDQLMALAVTEDHAAQETVWNSLPQYSRHAHALKASLTAEEIDASRDPMALYVGVKAYLTAGGSIRRDLFSDQETGYMQDPLLLQQLATEKLERMRAEHIQEGWSWSEVRLSMDHSERHQFDQVPNIPRKPTAEELARDGELQAEIEKFKERDDDDLTEDEEKKLWALEEERDELKASLREPDPAGKSYAGFIVTIDYKGRAEIIGGLVRAQDKKLIPRVTLAGNETDEGSEVSAVASPYSERLRKNLSAHLTAALQVKIAQDSHAALAALTHSLVLQVFCNRREWSHSGVVKINHTLTRLDQHALNLETAPALTALEQLYATWRDRFPEQGLLPWLLAQPQQELLQLMALCVASSVDCVSTGLASDDVKALGTAVSLDMADWWQPTADSFLSHVTKSVIVDTVNEAVSVDKGVPLAKLKKQEAVSAAQALLAGTRWVPPTMRL